MIVLRRVISATGGVALASAVVAFFVPAPAFWVEALGVLAILAGVLRLGLTDGGLAWVGLSPAGAEPPSPDQRRRQRRRFAFAIGSATALTALSLVGLEAASQALLPDYRPARLAETALQYDPAVYAIHAFPAHEQIVADPADPETPRYRINRLGYRGRSFDPIKPPGTVRIVFLGGSAVFDPDAPEGNDWPHRVEAILRRRGFDRVECVNAGIPGHASIDSLGRYVTEIHNFEPDLVLIYHVWNDAKLLRPLGYGGTLFRSLRPLEPERDPRRRPQGPLDALLCRSRFYSFLRLKALDKRLRLDVEGRPDEEAPRRATPTFPPRDSSDFDAFSRPLLDQFQLTLQTLIDAVRNSGAEPILIVPPRLIHESNSAQDRRRVKTQYVGFDYPRIVRLFDRMDDVIRDVAQEEQCPWLDLSAPFSGQRSLFRDHIHLTGEGGRAVALAVADFVQARYTPLLKSAEP